MLHDHVRRGNGAQFVCIEDVGLVGTFLGAAHKFNHTIGTLMIPRHQVKGNPGFGYPDERFKRHINQLLRDFASVEKVPAMYDAINPVFHGKGQGFVQVFKEIRPTPIALYSRSERQIKTQVRIRKEQYPD